MKNVTYFFILFLLTLTTPLFADKNSNEEVLKRLDRIIDNKTAYHVQKEKEIVDLKQRLHRSKDNREKYELCGSLFNAYLHYQADSALYYINGKMNLLPLLNHPELKNEIVINRATVMVVMGMYIEAIEQLEKINDPMVLSYLINGFYEKTKASLLKANETLEEINDKLFSKQIIEKLNDIKEKAEINASVYSANVLNNIDSLLLDLKQKENEITNIKKAEIKEVKIRDKWKINPFRILGIIVFGFLSLMMFISIFLPSSTTTDLIIKIIVFLDFATPLFFLIKKERKWRKEFSEYKMLQNEKRTTEKNRVLEAEQEYQERVSEYKEMLLQHPAFIAMQEINSNHPTFEIATSKISEIEQSFYKKWGISFENRNDGKVSEKVLNFIKKGEKLNAMKAYKDENNVSLNVALNYVEKISKDYKYKL